MKKRIFLIVVLILFIFLWTRPKYIIITSSFPSAIAVEVYNNEKLLDAFYLDQGVVFSKIYTLSGWHFNNLKLVTGIDSSNIINEKEYTVYPIIHSGIIINFEDVPTKAAFIQRHSFSFLFRPYVQ